MIFPSYWVECINITYDMWLTDCLAKGDERGWERNARKGKGKEKSLDEIVLEAFVFRYSRPEFPYFEN